MRKSDITKRTHRGIYMCLSHKDLRKCSPRRKAIESQTKANRSPISNWKLAIGNACLR